MPNTATWRMADRLTGGTLADLIAAYRRHQRAQEAPCEACKAAHAAYQRELYRKRRAT